MFLNHDKCSLRTNQSVWFLKIEYLCQKNTAMPLVYLGLGSNLGDKDQNLNEAVRTLSQELGAVLKLSAFYTSDPWGYQSKNEYLNAVVLVETLFSPNEVLAKTQMIERKLGRKAKTGDHYEDRLIDIDILLYDNLVIDRAELKIPHPLISKRDFVLIPLTEIAPELTDPVTHELFRNFIKQ
jgi:2-amino-4-hydroxy-6-hydroxymethyldihydropteridine diphosphokinase